ncbi:ABC transporter ATP-binding protein [Polaromonas jejuensis]|uniref:ABC transporter ATP-binding protein n=1 Tax=Polaromonas jejuensis TaxID=457502 RepID=A0ABW0QBF5_9BURK|nr:ABC transporter ATP-binding protein [Polaromonas jejuensis]
MSLAFHQLSYNYPGTRQGLKDLSFTVNSGELIAVIGPSGSGKSTLLKLVSGLTSGHSGHITLHGQDLANKPVHERNIGMVFQNYALFPHLNVLDNVAYGLRLRKMAKAPSHAKAAALLEAVGLSAFADRAVTQLSGGQQQRVALARALAIDPQALLLDEPLAALDASIRGHLRDQIREIQKRFNATTLLVTHDQEEALAMADRVAVLKDGCLLQLSTPKDIYEQPASTAVAQFVGLSTIFPGRVLSTDLIDLGFARLVAPTHKRVPGQSIHALMRPEHVQIDPPGNPANLMTGRVGAQRYLGAVSRFDFHVPGADKPLLAESRELPRHAVSVAPEHIRLLDS